MGGFSEVYVHLSTRGCQGSALLDFLKKTLNAIDPATLSRFALTSPFSAVYCCTMALRQFSVRCEPGSTKRFRFYSMPNLSRKLFGGSFV